MIERGFMKKTIYCLATLIAFSELGGCSWVKVSEAGKQVAILPASRVGDCVRLGTISTSVKDDIVGIDRKAENVQTELDRLAQDQAVLMNANSLVRVSIVHGRGSYVAYNCP
jgi:hypothetical protein